MKAKPGVIASIALLLGAHFASAATFTWDGGDATNSNFGQANNWNPNGAPATNANADLIFTGSVRLTPNAEAAYALNSITFASFAGANAFTIGGSQLTIGAGGVTNADGDTNKINNAIVLSAAQIWNATAGGLTFGGAVNNGGFLLTVAGAFSTSINGAISGSGGLTKNGSGALTIGGTSANTFSGDTTINSGGLFLAKSGANAIVSANLIIGDGLGGPEVDDVFVGLPNQIADTTAVIVNSSGYFELDASEQIGSLKVISSDNFVNVDIGPSIILTISTLTLTGGDIFGSAGATLKMGGNVTTNASAITAAISGSSNFGLDLGGSTRTFAVAAGSSSVDLDVNAVVSDGGINKTGAGLLELDGANTFAGGLTLSAGTLQIANDSAVGTGTLTVSGGTTLQALGTHTLSNAVAVNGNFTVGGSANLTLGGAMTIAASPFTVTVNNTAATTFAGGITASGDFIKSGTGTLTLSGSSANAFPSTVQVSQGTLELNKSVANGAVGQSLVISSGATVKLLQSDQIPDTGSVQVGNGATFNLNNFNEKIATLSTSGTVNFGIGVSQLTLTGDLTMGGSGSGGGTMSGDGTIVLGGNLVVGSATTTSTIATTFNVDLGGGTRTLNVADNAVPVDLYLGGYLSNGSIIKTGLGTVQLDGVNQITSATVNQGTVRLTFPGSMQGTLTIDGGLVSAEAQDAMTGASATINNGQLNVLGTSGIADLTMNGGSLTINHDLIVTGTFMENAGTESGGNTLVSQGSFIYNGGTFSSLLNNEGSATFNANFTAPNGLVNSANMTIGSGIVLNMNGHALDNEGTLTLNSSTFAGGSLTNNGLIIGNGTIGGTGLSNNSVINLSSADLFLTSSGTNTNTGTINGAAGLALQIDTNLTNTGTINLNGGTLRGAGTLTNAIGGTLATYGTVSIATLNNSGGTILAQGGTLQLNNALANPGIIEVVSGGTLAGAAITNTGGIQGAGTISNALTNASAGTIEPVNGTLTLTGAFANNSGATINAAIGNKLLVFSGLATNAGVIDLSGGTFDNNNNALSNTGSILGYGTFRTGGLTNNGSILFAGGSTSVSGDVTNASGHTIEVRNTPAIFTNNVTNNGTFKTTNTTATFAGTFTNNGIFTSDPATQYFQDLAIGSSGALLGGQGDIFVINGNVLNQSTQSSLFDISSAELTLAGGLAHSFTWSGADLGAGASGFNNNFALGIFELGAGAILQMFGGALYVHEFRLDGGLSQLADISDSQNIYYDANDSANAYLNDGTYSLQGGGLLLPAGGSGAVPEPGTVTLLALGALALGVRARQSRG